MSYQEQIIKHYESVWNHAAKIYLWDKGPIEKLPHDFRVLEFAPNRERDMWTYATCSMAQPMDAMPIELHIFSSIKDETIIELLNVAYYHRNTSMLGLNHTMNFGRPWQNISACNHGFISLPYLEGPDLEKMEVKQNKIIKFYWLIPLPIKKLILKCQKGLKLLKVKSKQNAFDYINPKRRSTVKLKYKIIT